MTEFSGSEIGNDGKDGKEPIARPQTNTQQTAEIGPIGRNAIQGEVAPVTSTTPEAVLPTPDRQPTPPSSFNPDLPPSPRPSEVLSPKAIESIRGV